MIEKRGAVTVHSRGITDGMRWLSLSQSAVLDFWSALLSSICSAGALMLFFRFDPPLGLLNSPRALVAH